MSRSVRDHQTIDFESRSDVAPRGDRAGGGRRCKARLPSEGRIRPGCEDGIPRADLQRLRPRQSNRHARGIRLHVGHRPRRHHGPLLDRAMSDDRVEIAASQRQEVAVDLDPVARGTVDGRSGQRSSARSDRWQRRQALQRAERVGDQPVAAHLVARKPMTVEEEDSMSGTAQVRRGGRTSRAGAHDHHVPRAMPKFVAGERREKHQRRFSAMK